MFPEETRGRQEKLKQIIYELSEELLGDDDQIKQVLNRLVLIYQDNFKHQYSDFFPIILKVYEEDNQYSIDYLSNNLDKLGTYLEDKYSKGEDEYIGIYSQFTKLCDNLNLQIAQFTYLLMKKPSDESIGIASENLQESNEKIEESLMKLDESNKKLDEANKKADTIQTELISILGIFAAIVIAFSGGLALLGNSVSSIANAAHYESVVLMAIICGMVMFNTIFLLMFFVSKMTERDILASCECKKCADCKKTKCKWLNKIIKRLPYVFYFNCFSIVGILIDMGIWFLDIKGYFG